MKLIYKTLSVSAHIRRVHRLDGDSAHGSQHDRDGGLQLKHLRGLDQRPKARRHIISVGSLSAVLSPETPYRGHHLTSSDRHRFFATVPVMYNDLQLETYSTVTEAEIDMTIATALWASESVWAWIWKEISSTDLDPPRLISAQRSSSVAGGREADVRVLAGAASRPVIVEIEDKIDAAFTPGQAQAYADRVRSYRGQSNVEDAFAVLIAPSFYIDRLDADDASCFDATISLEAVRDKLAEESAWGHSISLVIQTAVSGGRHGGGEDGALTASLRLFAARASSVGLKPPVVNPRQSSTELWFGLDHLVQVNDDENKYAALRVLPDRGTVEIELYGLRDMLNTETLRQDLGPPDPAMFLTERNVRLRRIATPIDLERDLGDQQGEIDRLWQTIRDLADWWNTQGIHRVRANEIHPSDASE